MKLRIYVGKNKNNLTLVSSKLGLLRNKRNMDNLVGKSLLRHAQAT
jgi:hypothetical protein